MTRMNSEFQQRALTGLELLGELFTEYLDLHRGGNQGLRLPAKW